MKNLFIPSLIIFTALSFFKFWFIFPLIICLALPVFEYFDYKKSYQKTINELSDKINKLESKLSKILISQLNKK